MIRPKEVYEHFLNNSDVFYKDNKNNINLRNGAIGKINNLIDDYEDYFLEIGTSKPPKISHYKDKEQILECYYQFNMLYKEFSVRLYCIKGGGANPLLTNK